MASLCCSVCALVLQTQICKTQQGEAFMRIIALTENTTENNSLDTEHGLSLYIETENHKILFDMGQTDLFEKNADKLGVDISAVDIAVLSHGHYDHGGGMERFLQINEKSPVYISKYAFEPHYSGTEKYIGLNTALCDNTRLIIVDDYLRLDNNLELFSCNLKNREHPTNSFGLNMITDNAMQPDDFKHEQYLLITEGDKRVLISGCSHKGILNIMQWFKPDVLVGGFHFMKLDPMGDGRAELKKSAEILKSFDTTYYTCHCTGTEQYSCIKEAMKNQVNYLSCGQEIIL